MGLLRWIARLLGIGGRRAPVRAGPRSAGRPSVEVGTSTSRRPPSTLAALEPGQFAPLGDAEALREASRLGSAGANPWFGRRDRIPPADDLRTQIIDRGMVAHGFITPEALVEIHEVGAAMDRARPDLVEARRRSEDAVRRSREEREELKRQKKAEAAERKRLRAEEIAQRRLTDIIYLGRGVSKGLAERAADVDRLRSLRLPVLATPADVAAVLELPVPRLRWLAFHTVAATRTHYVCFEVPKRSGGTRTLSAPHRDLARCQEWILRAVLAQVPVHDAAHGFIAGRSTVSGAAVHVGADVVLNVDLKDFFPTITFPRVLGTLRQLGYSPAVATVLALLCTECPRRTVEFAGTQYHVATGPRALPQGACTSPMLSNLVVRRLDARLHGIAAKLGWRYTRYADDLTFSASGETAGKVGYLLARIRHITDDEGFTINPPKTRVLRRNRAQLVTGVVVNERPGVPRTLVRRLRAILHRARTEGLAAQNRDGHPNFDAWLRGMIAYVAMVNPQQAEPLRAALDQLVE